jgi:Fe2+ or Zn2+ uptake regulation protein
MERRTSQKETIFQYLKSVKNHPTAEEIYLAVRKKLPRISLGTVYRILNNFKEKGEILELAGENNRYDGYIKPHGHFICEKCRKIYDIDGEFDMQPEKIKIGKVNKYQVYFYGLCNKCKKGR